MDDIIKESERRKITDRSLVGPVEKTRRWEQWYSKDALEKEMPKMNEFDYLTKSNQDFPNQVLINNRGKNTYTINEFSDCTKKIYNSLKKMGLKKGDVICLIGLSSPEMLEISYACASLGIIFCHLNFMDATDGKDELNKLYNQLMLVKPKLVLTLDILEDKVSEILNLNEFRDVIKVELPLDYSVPGSHYEKAKIELLKMKNKLTNKNIKNQMPFERFLIIGSRVSEENNSIETMYETKLASNIAFTSGTTGVNKAVLISHDANNALAEQHKRANLGLERGKRHLLLVPPFLAFWYADMVHMALCQGVENLLELSLDYDKIPKYMEKYKPQYGIWSQYLWDSVLHMPKDKRDELKEYLDKVVIGGERAELNQIESFYDLTGIVQEAGYGASEVNTCFSVANPRCYALGSAGLPLPKNNVKILDENGNSLTYGQTGRLFITGPCLMNGYYGRDDLTKNVLIPDEEGTLWYDTKDYAYVDENGCLFVLDRAKEKIEITVDGKKESIQLLDIVEKIKNNPNIKICKLSNYGEYIVLHVVLNDFVDISREDAIESIVQNIKNNLEEKYWPNAINFEESLPRTQVGKVDYKKLDNDTKAIFEKYNDNEKLRVINNYPKEFKLKLKKHV